MRIGFGVGDELGNASDRERWIDHHNVWDSDDTCDRCDVTDKIKVQLIKERRVNRIRSRNHEKGVAVRGCAHDRLGADVAAAAWPVLDDEWLAESLRQPLSHQTRGDVGST